jgi:hypothetical protein
MTEKYLNLGEAIRQARLRAARERNRAKCRRYYLRRVKKKGGEKLD